MWKTLSLLDIKGKRFFFVEEAIGYSLSIKEEDWSLINGHYCAKGLVAFAQVSSHIGREEDS